MLLSEEEVKQRLSSPSNLMNRLASPASSSKTSRNTAMSLFGIGSSASSASQRTFNRTAETKEAVPVTQSEPNSVTDQDPTLDPSQVKEPTNLIPFTNPFAELDKVVKDSKDSRDSKDSNKPTTTLDDLIDNADNKVKLATLHNTALDTLNSAMTRLNINIEAIHPKDLPPIISATNKVVESIRKEQLILAKQGENKSIHYHFYTPEQKKLSDYEIIDVSPTKESSIGAR